MPFYAYIIVAAMLLLMLAIVVFLRRLAACIMGAAVMAMMDMSGEVFAGSEDSFAEVFKRRYQTVYGVKPSGWTLLLARDARRWKGKA
jgi:hypothetical protein